MKEDKTYLFEEMSIPKAVTKLMIPTVIGCLVALIYNLADTFFVGMVNDPIQTAAVTFGATVILAFNAVTNLFGVGASSLMSRALGVKDIETFKRTSAFGFYCALVAAILYSVFCYTFNTPLLTLLGANQDNAAATSDYLFWTVVCGSAPAIMNIMLSYLVRSEGAALNASIGSMSGCIINIIIDPFFILPMGLNMGAKGAGLATFISNCIACGYFLIYLWVKRGKTNISINPGSFKPNKYIVKEVFMVGIPACVQNLLNVTGMTVLNNSMAEFGSEAVAAIGISQKTTMIPMYIAMGMSQGVMPLVGYNFSSGNMKRLNGAIMFTVKLSMTVAVVTSVLFFAFAPGITELFIENSKVIEYGSAFMRGLCLAQPFLAMDFFAVGVFQACGLGKLSFGFAIMRKILLEIPAIIVLNLIFPMYGLAYAQLFAEVVLAIAAIICLRRIMYPKKN